MACWPTAPPGHAVTLEDSLRDPVQWLGALTRTNAPDAARTTPGLVMDHELAMPWAGWMQRADALAGTRLGQMTRRPASLAVDFQAWWMHQRRCVSRRTV
jgi:hypothetical protein